MKRNLILCSAFFMLMACNKQQSNENLLASNADTTAVVNKISDEVIGDIIKSIPSPLEISSIIKESGGGYDKQLLNPADNTFNYNSNYKRAINLGIYGADLGYINIYNKSPEALSYLSSIKGLADDLNIGQFYDFETIKRLASNSENVDSLLYITTSNFEKINNFLHEQKRSDQSVLILAGGWIEALYISCAIAQKSKSEKLNEKIGEQKIVLDQILLLASNFKSKKEMADLLIDLENLKKVFNQVQISYTYKESTSEEVDGVLVIIDQSESKVIITDSQIEEIAKLTSDLRSKIIS